MSYVRLWVHLIWSTKNRDRIITDEIKPLLLNHIRQHARENGIFIDFLNAASDHIHLLISMEPEQNIAKCVQMIKGESAHWINTNHLLKFKFEWQDEYMALSISESMIDRIRNYIKGQEEHHRRKSFQEEYQEFIKIYKFMMQ